MPRSSTKPRRGNGDDRAAAAITPTLADRVAHLETGLVEVKRTLDVQFQRIAAMQAQLDHLSARKLP